MSAKWIRSKQWDDQNIPSWAWPVKFLLRAFSSITLAVILLSLIVVYAILASIPVGLIVLGLTTLIYGLTLVAAVAIGVLPVLVLRRLWRPKTMGGWSARFALTFALALGSAAFAAQLWYAHAWPHLMYDPAHHTGLRLFAGFIDEYRSTTLRRLPGFEMSELEFYSWWPLRVVLLLFVFNMVVATARRIEFIFPNLGVLTVHTGIVTIALGSVYYKGLKQEGDTILLAGEPGPDGAPTPGLPQTGFYDNTSVALLTRVGDSLWEQRLIQPPRYNDYNLAAGGGTTVLDVIGANSKRESAHQAAALSDAPDHGPLNLPVPRSSASKLDPDLKFRVVGYATYADPESVWVKADLAPGAKPQPVRFAQLRVHDAGGRNAAWPFFFLPDLPAQRLGETEVFGLEYLRGMDPHRFADLTAAIPDGARHALVVDVPARDGKPAFHGVYKIEDGTAITVGDTGYSLTVKQIEPEPPFPIITEGYRGATSSLAIVQVTPPASSTSAKPFSRYVYHRFPAINQDLLDELNDRGMPKRRDADPAIRIAYIDASKLQVYLDERTIADGDKPAGSVRTIVRLPAGAARVIENTPPGGLISDIMPGVDIQLTERWDHAVEDERPQPVPEQSRHKDDIGTHGHAMLAVEVSSAAAPWTRTIWIPFSRYPLMDPTTERTLALPDGRRLTLAFSRLRYPLPGFMIQLMDFKMIAYDHRGSPRDYQSALRVIPTHDSSSRREFEPYIHIASLNAPLQAPFHWDDAASWFSNALGTLSSRLSPRQFKFSQAGWDQQGWAKTQKLADAGQLPRPYASFTILGVGNNPGIHVIALGAILMSLGIPWAFYVKPLIMKRRRDKLKASLATGSTGGTGPTVVPQFAASSPRTVNTADSAAIPQPTGDRA